MQDDKLSSFFRKFSVSLLRMSLYVLLALFIVAAGNINTADAEFTVLLQPRTLPGDPYPCNLWFQWCDPETWPSDAIYAAPWDDANGPGFIQILAEDFVLESTVLITGIKVWGGYWWRDIAPASDDFTIIFHNDAGNTIGTLAAVPVFTTSRDDTGAVWVTMKWCPSCNGNSLIFEYTFTMTEPVTLGPGTYWVEIYNDTAGHLANNDFFWVWGHLDELTGIDGLAWTSASAPGSNWNYDANGNLAIEITADIASVEVSVDVKPGSCPNPLNLKKKGVLPAAILGTAELDVTTIDPDSVTLAGVQPIRWSIEDVSTLFEPLTGKNGCDDCNELGPDGFADLTLKFDAREIINALGIELEDGQCILLDMAGSLMEEFGGTEIYGEDCIIIRKKGK